MPFPEKKDAGTRQWFILSTAGDIPEVFIYDEIGRGFFGGGVPAEEFIGKVKALNLKASDELLVRINSPGGDFFDGNAIYNYLRSLKAKVTARIDGVAASAASMIAMAADRVEMPENSFLFLHHPLTYTIGNATKHRQVAADLEKMSEAAIGMYERRSGLSRDKISQILDGPDNQGTWLTAIESVDYGFADIVDEPVRAAALARFDLSAYGFPIPEAVIKARKCDISDRRAILTKLRDAGGASTAGANATRNIAK
jgi:ATP-dependent protease ClpP protease subunit